MILSMRNVPSYNLPPAEIFGLCFESGSQSGPNWNKSRSEPFDVPLRLSRSAQAYFLFRLRNLRQDAHQTRCTLLTTVIFAFSFSFITFILASHSGAEEIAIRRDC
ncbi:hypothetical protein SISSUDRAFT_791205 [Sistotremastrum suecicum HHB10207 ss-3]|uniref:Uncharacterized protein n=1 Tax=Sistotremastrum suecicum HHB10207 ss-3 TaxID=1314776 RepID=A0A166CZN7_9AGAM|nr:hypothetical protein SISSUDRAFT_791205 [Sistotremastrum suecicum HHB10207 ss-3]